jgi:hypothetical protein
MSTPELATMQQRLEEATREIQRLGLIAATASTAAASVVPIGTADKKLESIIDTRIVNKIGSFSGNDEDWKAWCLVFESTVGLVDLEGVMLGAETNDEPNLDFNMQTDELKLRMKALYHLLVATTRGRALTIMQMVPRNNGAIGW